MDRRIEFSHVLVARMDGYGPALPAVGPVLVPLEFSHVLVARMDGYGPALPAVGPVLVPLE